MATIEHVAATASPNEIIEHLQKDGAVIVDKVLPADDVARLNSELKSLLEDPSFQTNRLCLRQLSNYRMQMLHHWLHA